MISLLAVVRRYGGDHDGTNKTNTALRLRTQTSLRGSDRLDLPILWRTPPDRN